MTDSFLKLQNLFMLFAKTNISQIDDTIEAVLNFGML